MPIRSDLERIVRESVRPLTHPRELIASLRPSFAGLWQALGLFGISALPTLGSYWIAYCVLSTFEGGGGGGALAAFVQLGCATLGTAAFAPLQIAGVLLFVGAPTLTHALADAFVSSARRPAATATIGALQGALVSAPCSILALDIGTPHALYAIAIAALLSTPFALVLVRGLAAPSNNPVGPLSRLAIAPSLVVVAAVLTVLAIEPPALSTDVTRDVVPRSDAALDRTNDGPVIVMTQDGTRRPLRVAFSVALDLVGRVRAPRPDRQPVCDRDWYCAELEPGWPSSGLVERLLARSAPITSAALASAALLGIVLLAQLAALRRRVLSRPTEATTTKVRFRSSGARLKVVRDKVVADGLTLVTTDADLVVRHDGPLVVLGSVDELLPGAELWLVTPTPLPRVGPREGATHLPAGSWVATADQSPSAALALHQARRVALTAACLLVVSTFGAAMLVMLV